MAGLTYETLSLKDIVDTPNPNHDYATKQVSVKVLHVGDKKQYKNEADKTIGYLPLVIGDGTSVFRCNCYNQDAESLCIKDKGLMIKGFTADASRVLSIRYNSNVGRCRAPDITAEAAEQGVREFTTDISTIAQILKNEPGGRKYNIKVVVKDGGCNVPTLKGTAKKDVVLEDATGEISATLWKALAQSPLKKGDVLEIRNCKMSNWKGKKLDFNQDTTEIIKVRKEEAAEAVELKIDSLRKITREETQMFVGSTIFTVPTSVLMSYLKIDPYDEEKIEDACMALLPLNIRVQCFGKEIIAITD